MEKIALLDDDATGVQTLAGINALLDWEPPRVSDGFAQSNGVYILTNSRALTPSAARRTAASASAAVRKFAPDAAMVLRGDSTLRGHLLDEYLGVCDQRGASKLPTLLLAPALPSAGRVTVGGVQFVERAGIRVPVHETEFATDGIFSYSTSRLVDWAGERSDGLFSPAAGVEIGLHAIRTGGADVVAGALLEAEGTTRPTVVVADSETTEDVREVVAGFRCALREGANVVLRCGPAGAGALFDAIATGLVAPRFSREVLVVCGSYVPESSRQLEALVARHPDSLITVDLRALAAQDQARPPGWSSVPRSRLKEAGLAVIATPRSRPDDMKDLGSGMKVAHGLAELVRQIDCPDAVTVTKGGITSAVSVRVGLGATTAEVVGPVLPGVSMWRVSDDLGRIRTVLIVPGNVGEDALLVRIVDLVQGRVE